ncbi:MAG TPA: hypothetical protein VKJ00_13365 [Thermoanaerobaculia bacterium]|nr:hypothetical protein [Thermoanaerobaculia bacterium]
MPSLWIVMLKALSIPAAPRLTSLQWPLLVVELAAACLLLSQGAIASAVLAALRVFLRF